MNRHERELYVACPALLGLLAFGFTMGYALENRSSALLAAAIVCWILTGVTATLYCALEEKDRRRQLRPPSPSSKIRSQQGSTPTPCSPRLATLNPTAPPSPRFPPLGQTQSHSPAYESALRSSSCQSIV